jgi:hypothetical protein
MKFVAYEQIRHMKVTTYSKKKRHMKVTMTTINYFSLKKIMIIKNKIFSVPNIQKHYKVQIKYS